MNAETRKKVQEIRGKLETLQTTAAGIVEELTELSSDEQDKFDNLNEGLQAGEKGQLLEQAATGLSDAASAVESAASSAEEAIGYLDGIE